MIGLTHCGITLRTMLFGLSRDLLLEFNIILIRLRYLYA